MTKVSASQSRFAVLKTRKDYLAVATARQSCGAVGLVLQSAESGCLSGRLSGRLKETRGLKTGREAVEAQANEQEIRIGFTASKKVGGAVRRNRAKRRLRSLGREILAQEALPSHSYVLIARHSTPERSWEKLCADLRYCLKKLGLKRRSHSKNFEKKASWTSDEG